MKLETESAIGRIIESMSTSRVGLLVSMVMVLSVNTEVEGIHEVFTHKIRFIASTKAGFDPLCLSQLQSMPFLRNDVVGDALWHMLIHNT